MDPLARILKKLSAANHRFAKFDCHSQQTEGTTSCHHCHCQAAEGTTVCHSQLTKSITGCPGYKNKSAACWVDCQGRPAACWVGCHDWLTTRGPHCLGREDKTANRWTSQGDSTRSTAISSTASSFSAARGEEPGGCNGALEGSFGEAGGTTQQCEKKTTRRQMVPDLWRWWLGNQNPLKFQVLMELVYGSYQQFEVTTAYNRWTYVERAIAITVHLKGVAQQVLAALHPSDIIEYVSLVICLEQRFGQKLLASMKGRKLRNRIQNSGEELQDYAADIRRLA